MGRYKHGKQKEIIPYPEIVERMKQATANGLELEKRAYFWILYYCGVRKSEAYERTIDDVVVTDESIILDFHKRKKGGETVTPLEIPRFFVGMDDLVKQHKAMSERKPYTKSVYVRESHKWVKQSIKGKWLFPKIQSSSAWYVIKKILGENYYPHFLRLNRISEICLEPSANMVRVKSFTGIKTARIIDAYLGTAKKEQTIAFKLMAENIRKQMETENRDSETTQYGLQ